MAVEVGRAVAGVSRGLGRGNGSVVGGRATLALDGRSLQLLAGRHRVAVVSGTNGKTTTTSLLSSALSTVGPVVSNMLGANLPTGLVSTLAAAEPGQLAALEVDEAWLGRVVAATRPRVAVLLNLSRDQLDRNNEVRRLAGSWRKTVVATPDLHVVANADDPLVAWAAQPAPQVTWVAAGQPWTADASGCPACGARIVFSEQGWSCSSCSLRRPVPEVWLAGDDLVAAEGVADGLVADGRVTDGLVVAGGAFRAPLRLSLPGRCNRSNAAMAWAAARRLGADPAAALAAMAHTAEVAGRYKVLQFGQLQARMLLAKNPAGWLEVFDVLDPVPTPVVVAINARIADGRDPSWLWDVPFERLAGRPVVATGERSRDLAVRLHYADVPHQHERDPVAALRLAADYSEAIVHSEVTLHAKAAVYPEAAAAEPRPGPGLDPGPPERAQERRPAEQPPDPGPAERGQDPGPAPRPAGPRRRVDVVANYTAFQSLSGRLAGAAARGRLE